MTIYLVIEMIGNTPEVHDVFLDKARAEYYATLVKNNTLHPVKVVKKTIAL